MALNTHELAMWGLGIDWALQKFDICKIAQLNSTFPVNIGDGFYAYIRNQSEDVYLTNKQSDIIGETFTGEANQIWRFDRQHNGAYSITSIHDNACMDVWGRQLKAVQRSMLTAAVPF